MQKTSGNSWIYDTGISIAIRDTSWVIPVIQSIHLCAIAVVISGALVSDLRLAGLLATDESASTVVRRYFPWMQGALAVLLVSGAAMVIAEPDRTLGSYVFWFKMALVLTGFVLTILFRKPFLDPNFRAEQATWMRLVRPAAYASLAIWVAVIFCGRWIAYSAA